MSTLRVRRASGHCVATIELLEDRRLLSAAEHIALSRPSAPVHGVAGVTLGAAPIAIVRSANPAALTPVLQAVVFWGDDTSGGVVQGTFQVDAAHADRIILPADHFYAKPGVYHITVSVNNAGQSLGTLHETARIAAHSSNGRTIHATAGQEFLAQLGTLPERGINSTGLSISWGDTYDGSASTPFVSGSNPTIVSGNQTYAQAGSYEVTVSLSLDTFALAGAHTLITDRVIVHAARMPLSEKTLHTIILPFPKRAAVAETLSRDLANLTGIPASIPSATATINWGDGTPVQTSAQNIGNDAAAFGTHAYQNPGNYIVTGTFTNTATGAVLGKPFKERITVAETIPGGVLLKSVTGTQFQGVVGTLMMSPAPTQVGIEWGDGTHSDGTFKALGHNQYQVSGSHTYSNPGTYSVQVIGAAGYDPFPLPSPSDVFINGLPTKGFTGALFSTVAVTGTPVPVVTPDQITPLAVPDVTAQTTFDATLATLSGYPTDANSAALVYAQIDWGNGYSTHSSLSIPVTVEDGKYVVQASYAYEIWDAAPRTFTVSVTFLRNDSDTGNDILGSTQTSITVLPANTPGGVTLNLTQGTHFSRSVGTVQNYYGDGSVAPNSIDWGDGTGPTSAITTTLQSDNTYLVIAAHTYAQAGAYRIVVSHVDSLGTQELIESRAVVGG